MKITKKIIAVVLTVMMLALMVPFSASAADGDVSFKVNCTKDGYEFTVYQVATVEAQFNTYNMVATDTAIKNAVMASQTSHKTADILTACNNTTETLSQVGDVYVSNSGEKTYTVAPGIYYVKCTKSPSTVKSITNSIVALPYYDSTNGWVSTLAGTIDLAAKVSDGDVVVSKKFNETSNKYLTKNVGEDVAYTLTSSVVGSTEKALKKYAVVDKMSTGLTFKQIDSVKLTGSTTSAPDYTLSASQYSVVTDYQTKDGKTNTFAVVLDPSVYAAANTVGFYDFTNVEVAFTAILNNKAVIGPTGNANTDLLEYTNADDLQTDVAGDTVKVYTFGIIINKYDVADTSALSGAVFGIYKDSDPNQTIIAKAVTGSNGAGKFMEIDANGNITSNEYKFGEGKYHTVELVAPEGYNKSDYRNPVNIVAKFSNDELTSPVTGYVAIALGNAAIVTPQTGGMGTMMFTIGGAALIACAGILFIILIKKRKKAGK